MTRADEILWLANRISPTREGWAWTNCHGGMHAVKPNLCPECHGTGRVPAPLDQPEYTLRLDEWANDRPWYDKTAPPDRTRVKPTEETHAQRIGSILRWRMPAITKALNVFLEVYTAERTWAEKESGK